MKEPRFVQDYTMLIDMLEKMQAEEA